jgi:hypothetical protein
VAGLDKYSDRPVVGANPPIYKRTLISDEIADSAGVKRVYIGVELIPESNGTLGTRRRLADRALDTGIFDLPKEGEDPKPYSGGDVVWMNMR